MSGNVQDIADAIREIVREAGRVTGAQLAVALRRRVPGWKPSEFGVRTQRAFISTHVPDVVVVARSGLDTVYGRKDAEPKPEGASPSAADFWRIWVSPNSPFAIWVDRTDYGLHAAPRRSLVPPEQLLLEPPPIAAHRQFAREFLADFSGPMRDDLQAALADPSNEWRQRWYGALRNTEYLRAWNAFRRQRFEDLLATSLQMAGIDASHIEGILNLVKKSHVSNVEPQLRPSAPAPSNLTDPDLRSLVVDVIRNMSTTELRELRLPVGLVLDAIARQHLDKR